MNTITQPTKTLLLFKLKDNDTGDIINVCIPVDDKQLIYDADGDATGVIQNGNDLNFKLLLKSIKHLKCEIIGIDKAMLIDAYAHNQVSPTLN